MEAGITILLEPMGPSPTTITCVNGPEGVTVTDRVCPGAAKLPLDGEVMVSVGAATNRVAEKATEAVETLHFVFEYSEG